jgi:hypothetical protein
MIIHVENPKEPTRTTTTPPAKYKASAMMSK